MKRNYDNSSRSGLKDVWNAFMCEGATYSKNDIPFCPTILTDLPLEILTWPEAKELHKKLIKEDKDYFYDAFICTYCDDQKFDGARTSIWTYPWLALRIMKHFRGIITVDFSTYQDFPFPLKIYNTYRMRAFGFWAGKQGLEVINNVRWGYPDTYEYCFDGIEENSIVAIGTVGGSPWGLDDRERFEEGLFELVDRLKPHTIIVYGSANYPCFQKLRDSGIKVISYKSSTAKYYERRGKNE